MSAISPLKILLMSCGLSLAMPVTSCAQASLDSDVETEISKLDFLVGYWGGEGVSYEADGTARPYYDTEHVRFDLDGNLLLINAKGERDGQTTYQLHTTIYYDAEAGHYVYTPYSGQRAPRPFHCELTVKKQFTCLTAAKTFRLNFQRLDDGRWNEYGERLGEDGVWRKTFETKLRAVSPD